MRIGFSLAGTQRLIPSEGGRAQNCSGPEWCAVNARVKATPCGLSLYSLTGPSKDQSYCLMHSRCSEKEASPEAFAGMEVTYVLRSESQASSYIIYRSLVQWLVLLTYTYLQNDC